MTPVVSHVPYDGIYLLLFYKEHPVLYALILGKSKPII